MSDFDTIDADDFDSADDTVYAGELELGSEMNNVNGLLYRYWNDLDVAVDVTVEGTTKSDSTHVDREHVPQWNHPMPLDDCGPSDIEADGGADYDEIENPMWRFTRVGVTPSGDEPPTEGEFKLDGKRRYGDSY